MNDPGSQVSIRSLDSMKMSQTIVRMSESGPKFDARNICKSVFILIIVIFCIALTFSLFAFVVYLLNNYKDTPIWNPFAEPKEEFMVVTTERSVPTTRRIITSTAKTTSTSTQSIPTLQPTTSTTQKSQPVLHGIFFGSSFCLKIFYKF
jgi:hypothetical protein